METSTIARKIARTSNNTDRWLFRLLANAAAHPYVEKIAPKGAIAAKMSITTVTGKAIPAEFEFGYQL